MKFTVDKLEPVEPGSSPDKYTWWLLDDSVGVLACGAIYLTRSDAAGAAKDFKQVASAARYEIFVDRGGRRRWRCWDDDHVLAQSPEPFASDADTQRAIDLVRGRATDATGP